VSWECCRKGKNAKYAFNVEIEKGGETPNLKGIGIPTLTRSEFYFCR
jgi:hypothetical protein